MVTASQQDAGVWVNGLYVGQTPICTPVKRNEPFTVEARKEGFESASKTVDRHFSGTAVADLIGCAFLLLPGLGLLTPGAWDLDQTAVELHLYPKPAR